MRNKPRSQPLWGKPLDTLAQTGTGFYSENGEKPAIIYTGQGSELSNEKAMKGRAKRKLIGQQLALSLIDVAIRKGNPEKTKAFWNTYYCIKRVVTVEGRYYGKYCKNRFCPVCSSIRKADIINRYYPVIKTWAKPFLVTLTILNCKAERLNATLRKMMSILQGITAKHRKDNLRGKGMKLMGVKSLECNFNPVTQTYHPHFHLIVPDKKTANTLMTAWLKKWGVHYASGSGQHKRPIDNMEQALIEVIKYGSKIFTEPDLHNKIKGIGDRDIYPAALYNILDAMDGLRIFERFGFNLPSGSKLQPTGARIAEKYAEWVYVTEYHDWLSTENELVLMNYTAPEQLLNLLEYHIRTDRE